MSCMFCPIPSVDSCSFRYSTGKRDMKSVRWRGDMKSMRPPSAIFFLTYFYTNGRDMAAFLSRPLFTGLYVALHIIDTNNSYTLMYVSKHDISCVNIGNCMKTY